MLTIMVGITSWVIRIIAFISLVVFFLGGYIFVYGWANDYEIRIMVGAVMMGLSFLFMIIGGAVAVVFRISEQMGETNRHLAYMLAPALDRISAQLDGNNRNLPSLQHEGDREVED